MHAEMLIRNPEGAYKEYVGIY